MELPDAERSRVVLIGASRFDNPDLADLPAVEANIRALAARLTKPEFWGVPAKHCREVLNPDSLVTLVEPIHDAALEAEDTLLIYYAGHGFVHPRSLDLLLALTGSDPERPYTAVAYDQVRYNVLNSPAKRKIVILDCCFSGRAFGSQGDADDVASGTTIEGTYLLTSAPPNKQSLSFPGEPYTAFTGALLDVLENGIRGGGEYLRLHSVYQSVRLALRKAGRTEPQLRVDNNIGELALGRNARFPDNEPYRSTEPIATPDSELTAGDAMADYLAEAPRLDLPAERYGRIVIEPLGIVAKVEEILQRKQTTPRAAQPPVLHTDTDADSDSPAWDTLLGRHASHSARRRRTRRPTDEAPRRSQPETMAWLDEILGRKRDSPVTKPSTGTQKDPPAETKVLARPLLHVVSETGVHELRIAPAEFPDGNPARLRVVSWEQPILETFPADRVLLTVRRPDGVHLRLRAPIGGALLNYSGIVMEHGTVATFRPSPPSSFGPVASERRGIRRQVLNLGFAAHAALRPWRGLFWSPSTPEGNPPHVVMLPGAARPGAFIAEGGFVAAVLLNGSETVELLSPVAGRLVESSHRPGTPLAEEEPVAFIDIDNGSGPRRQPQPA